MHVITGIVRYTLNAGTAKHISMIKFELPSFFAKKEG